MMPPVRRNAAIDKSQQRQSHYAQKTLAADIVRASKLIREIAREGKPMPRGTDFAQMIGASYRRSEDVLAEMKRRGIITITNPAPNKRIVWIDGMRTGEPIDGPLSRPQSGACPEVASKIYDRAMRAYYDRHRATHKAVLQVTR